jgi:DNA-binding CsgD family transcriptional regulator
MTNLSLISGISVTQEMPKLILNKSLLYKKLIENEFIISKCRPILNKAFQYFINKTNLLILTDTSGYIIDLISSPEVLLIYFNKGITLGSCMNYDSFGTTAISMALYYKSPVLLTGPNHLCKSLKDFQCLSIPLEVNNKLIGVLDISVIDPKDIAYFSSFIIIFKDLLEKSLNHHVCPSVPSFEKNHSKYEKIIFFGSVIVNSKFSFTIKEVDILYKLYTEKSFDNIIFELHISQNTLKTHLKHIYQKLEVKSLHECMQKLQELLIQ